MEGENPTRRYKWFRPRQAACAAAANVTTADYGTFFLFNNSQGSHYLVVVDAFLPIGSAIGARIKKSQGFSGSIANPTYPFIAGEATLPGLLYYSDEATAFTDYDQLAQTYNPAFNNMVVPRAVIPPGWSWVVGSPSHGVEVSISVLWEAIFPDELDWLW